MSPSASLSFADWSLEPTVLLGLAVLVVGYLFSMRRGGTASAARATWFALGISALFVALQSPIDVGGDRYLFSLHMLQHVVLAMVAPPLLLLGAASLLPSRTGRVLGPLVNPWVAGILFNAVLLAWHWPSLYDATLRFGPLHVFEHLTFFLTGLCFWWPVVAPARDPAMGRGLGSLAKIGYLVFTNIPPTVLGLLLTLAPAASYSFYAQAPRLWGLSPVEDQQLAGLIMFGGGGAIYVIAMAVLFLAFSREREREPAGV